MTETQKGQAQRERGWAPAAPWQLHQPGVSSVSAEASQQDEADISHTACHELPVSQEGALVGGAVA